MHPETPLSPKALKTTQLALVGAFAFLPVLLFFVSGSPSSPPAGDTTQATLFVAISVAAWLAGLAVCLRRLAVRGEVDGTAQLPPPQLFQTNMLIALALFELPSLLGFVLAIAGKPAVRIPLMGATLVGDLLFVLPAVLRYWSLVEGAGRE